MIFTKMHGLGNDYVCINCFRERVEDPPGFARTLCDRHYGIGADGLILICPSKVSDFKMEIYNSDGSVAGMCGNGIRCLGKYVYDSYSKTETKDVFKYKNENVYMLQYGVYSSEENMINNTKNLKNYFYFKDNDGYHAIIGITKNENLKEKIVDSYKITENIYMKRVNIDNSEFITLLDQYDNLIKDADDKTTIFNAQKQVLSKYEELILQNG